MKPSTRREANPGEKLIAKNRRATFDYEIEERFEAGIVLVGSEVKALRAGKVDVSDAFAAVERGEAWLRQLNIGPFEMAACYPHEAKRPRKLLLHRREIERLERAVSREGCTVVPLRLYFREGRVKVELALARGKKLADKRHAIAQKTAEREARAAMKARRTG